ncbi:MAG TPA: hypothetical protein VHO70_08795 [Chitinispirillaceae bacterium]|nr:hypothetical protein [Chitinispirillaceae bacterium]
MSENRVSIQFTPEQLAAIEGAVNTISNILAPVCVTLTPDQRRQILKMGPSSEPIVNAANLCAQQNPQFVPSFVDAAELNKDVTVVNELTKISNIIAPIVQMVDDTRMLAGSEAMTASLPIYGSVKIAAKNNIAGAEVAYKILKDLLPQIKRKNANTTQAAEAS